MEMGGSLGGKATSVHHWRAGLGVLALSRKGSRTPSSAAGSDCGGISEKVPIFSEWVSLEKLGTRHWGTRENREKMENVGCSQSSWVSGWGYVCRGCRVKQ